MTSKELQLADQLEAAFKGMKTFPVKYYDRVKGIMAQAPDEALKEIRNRHIPFLDTLSISELVARGIMSEDDRTSHIAHLITDRVINEMKGKEE